MRSTTHIFEVTRHQYGISARIPQSFRGETSGGVAKCQPRTQASSRYPSDQRRLGTERDSASASFFPTSLTGDVTSENAVNDWERGWRNVSCFSQATKVENTIIFFKFR